MSDESSLREPTDPELRLLRRLGARAHWNMPDWLEGLRVRSMEDGGMGSLLLLVRDASTTERRFGGRVAEYEFTDVDGVPVLASLNVDRNGLPFELDVWKIDFQPLIRIPDELA